MTPSLFTLAVLSVLAAAPPGTTGSEEQPVAKQWLPVFDAVAAEYALRPESEANDLKLLTSPVYKWARPGPDGGTNGAVYVWTREGCAESVACFWRSPTPDGKGSNIAHELHSLSPAILKSARGGANQWNPAAGLTRHLLPGAPPPAASPSGRSQQMRVFCHDFSAHTVSSGGDRTELRLLPQPLYRYQSTGSSVIDGSLFAFVCSVGTDPEVFLLLEVLSTADGPRWHYAVARFSHHNMFVKYQEQPVWQSIRTPQDTIAHSADRTYWLFHEPFTGALPKLKSEN
jgi:hypothetical protein